MLLSFRTLVVIVLGLFFFKQKTAYEMRISDWSSDVCSSDLRARRGRGGGRTRWLRRAPLARRQQPRRGRRGRAARRLRPRRLPAAGRHRSLLAEDRKSVV